MQQSQAVPSLQPVHDVSDLWVDALLTDDANQVVFVSVWGRDTAVQELLARLSLPPKDGGLDGIRIGNLQHRVNVERLTKLTGRMPRDNIFGDLVHTWLYDESAMKPDGVNRRAVLLYREDEQGDDGVSLGQRLWAMVKETCHLPLLDHWRDILLPEFTSHGWIVHWVGVAVSAYAIRLGGDEVEHLMTELIRSGRLRLDEGDTSPLPDMSATAPAEDSLFGEVLYSYTREQALADGYLVDVSGRARELGFRFPVAMTRAAWEDCVAWDEADNERKRAGQDESGRLHDVLWMALNAIRGSRSSSRVDYELYRVPREGQSVQPVRVELKAVVGPGDNMEPVITIMQPHED